VGDDWRFELSVESAPPPAEGGFSLGLLDTELLAWRSVPLEVGEEEGGRTVLWARGLARELAGPAPAGRWLWILDYRIDGHAVFRSRGRLP
jgi:hypothetical protein